MFLLQKVTNLDFSWVSPRPDEVPGLANGSHAAGSNVMITFSKRSVSLNQQRFRGMAMLQNNFLRDPFAPLPKDKMNKLVVAMFAWDGNSFVGNEYWDGMLSASGDPAAACCSLIPEVTNNFQESKFTILPQLLNPDINPKIRGDATMVASPTKGLIPIKDNI